MLAYRFDVLNDKEFEELVRELLQRSLGCEFQSFKTGKDKGIDLRYSTDRDNEIIVQVKHYVNSAFSNLKSNLLKEQQKVDALKPRRYIIVTSLDLNPQQVEIVRDLFPRYVKSLQDIYGRTRLNAILSANPDIEKKFFKLWLSSVNVLSIVLNNSTYLRADVLESEITRRISRYVVTKQHLLAYKNLLSNRIVLITGPPGAGKSTLANILIYRVIHDLECELVVIEDKLAEADAVLALNNEKKQIVYFDDFLGSNIYELLNPRNSDGSIVRFINRIKAIPNKYLVLTTRTTILNSALDNFEKLRHSKIDDIYKFEIELSDYSDFEKAKILYNHIYFGGITQEYCDEVIADENYLKIVKHRNFNPRIIEFITNPEYLENIERSDYINFIFEKLENPSDIWKGSYTNQLEDDDRFLLTTLLSYVGKIEIEILRDSFYARIQYEIEENGYSMKEDAFNRSLKRLLNGYLHSTLTSKNSNQEPHHLISFSNPSIGDFLISHLRNSQLERKRILHSFVHTEQLFNTFHPSDENYINLTKGDLDSLYASLTERRKLLRCISSDKSVALEIMDMYLTYFPHRDVSHDLRSIYLEKPLYLYSPVQVDKAISILNRLKQYTEIRILIEKDWQKLISHGYKMSYSEGHFSGLRALFSYYNVSFEDFLANPNNCDTVEVALSEFFSDRVQDALIENYQYYDYNLEPEYYSVSGDELEGVDYYYTLSTDLKEEAQNILDTLISEYDILKITDHVDIYLDVNYESLKSDFEAKYGEEQDHDYDRSDIYVEKVRFKANDEIHKLFMK